jgi:hypothetical protein
MNFSKWFNEQSTIGTEFVDEKQIDTAYNKAKYAVRIVQLYDQATKQNLLTRINTIANLQSGAYGIFMSSEDRKYFSSKAIKGLRMVFDKELLDSGKIHQVAKSVILQKLNQAGISLGPNDLIANATIRVNIAKHLSDSRYSELDRIVRIASTIVHEAVHVKEHEEQGRTGEMGPEAAEKHFRQWAHQNWNMILSKIPDLQKLK